MNTFALTAYPLSHDFRRELERAARSEVEILLLPELRRLGPAALARRLFGLRGRCYLALEDPASETLLPILEGLASLTRADTIEIARRGGAVERTSRLRGAAHAARLAAASVEAQAALRRARRELGGLLAAPRAGVGRGPLERVLYLSTNLWFGVAAGGSVAHTAGVVNALAQSGLDVTLASAAEPVGVDDAVRIRRLRPPASYALPVESNLYRFGRSVPHQVRDLPRPSFVYQRHSVGSYAGAVLGRSLGVPLVLEYNGSEVWVARNWGRPLRYERLAVDAEEASLRHAHLVVTVSRALADELTARGIEPERVVWHPNGVDPELFDPQRFPDGARRRLRDDYGIPADATLATFVGTFGQWHGVDVLAEAIARSASTWRATRVRFLLVGDGLKMEDVRSRLRGAEDVVVLAGLVPQADAPLHLAASDVLVSPHVRNADGSPFFGSPTKLFEYMAAAKAIVASDLDQVGDVLRGGAAELVPPGDPAALAAAIERLAGDADTRRRLGEKARRRVLDRYTWRHHTDAVLAALDRALSGG